MPHMEKQIPFKVRRAIRIDYELDDKAIVDGFIGVPVYTFSAHPDKMIESDSLDTVACNYAAEAEKYYSKLDSSYGEHIELVKRLNESVSNALNLTDDQRTHMDFYNMTMYTDTIFARQFEGLPIYGNFSAAQMHDIYEVNKWAQTNKFHPEARAIWMTRIFSYPMQLMEVFLDRFASHLLDFQP